VKGAEGTQLPSQFPARGGTVSAVFTASPPGGDGGTARSPVEHFEEPLRKHLGPAMEQSHSFALVPGSQQLSRCWY
jgi:hypothetical protein